MINKFYDTFFYPLSLVCITLILHTGLFLHNTEISVMQKESYFFKFIICIGYIILIYVYSFIFSKNKSFIIFIISLTMVNLCLYIFLVDLLTFKSYIFNPMGVLFEYIIKILNSICQPLMNNIFNSLLSQINTIIATVTAVGLVNDKHNLYSYFNYFWVLLKLTYLIGIYMNKVTISYTLLGAMIERITSPIKAHFLVTPLEFNLIIEGYILSKIFLYNIFLCLFIVYTIKFIFYIYKRRISIYIFFILLSLYF
jgi:hypothetical protein